MQKFHEKALDLLEEGKWEEAHSLVGGESDEFSALIHALVHRHEGDTGNAAYWYRRAGEEPPQNSLKEELARLRAMGVKM